MDEVNYPTVIQGLNESAYHARPEVSKSMLDKINRSPRLYWHAYIEKDLPPYSSDAMTMGSCVHLMLLEPNRAGEIAVRPKVDRRTKAGKEAYAAWYEEFGAADLILDEEQYGHATRAVEAVREHPLAAQLLAQAHSYEASMFAKDEETGLALRGRADVILKNGSIVDLKTTRDATPRGFRSSMYKFRYDVQAAYYVDLAKRCGYDTERFFFIAVEPNPPYPVAVYWTSPYTLEQGKVQYRENLDLLARCLEADHWPEFQGAEL